MAYVLLKFVHDASVGGGIAADKTSCGVDPESKYLYPTLIQLMNVGLRYRKKLTQNVVVNADTIVGSNSPALSNSIVPAPVCDFVNDE
jgi:hypothetical protein